MTSLVNLTRYKSWANQVLYASLSRLSEDELVSERPIVFGSILATLNHVYAMDQVWQANLRGTPHGFSTRNPGALHGFQELHAFQRWIDDWYVKYASGLSLERRLRDQPVEFTFIGGDRGRMTRGDIVVHVVNHTTYHRGHIADILYTIGVQPPTTDLPVFLRATASGAANASAY